MARHNGAEETVIGDLTDPASLTDAVTGMEGVFHIGPAHAAGEAEMVWRWSTRPGQPVCESSSIRALFIPRFRR